MDSRLHGNDTLYVCFFVIPRLDRGIQKVLCYMIFNFFTKEPFLFTVISHSFEGLSYSYTIDTSSCLSGEFDLSVRGSYSGLVRPCRIANLTRPGMALMPSFCISRLR